ncbi:MAG: serine hydrolase [Lewinellaceae bacterium]|nr:serine hydrolase [Lewinellaceae bacterium]
MQKLKTSLIVLLGCLIFQHCTPSAGPAEEKDTADKISEYLTTIESQGFDGAVLVAQKGEILVSDGYGLSDVEKNIRNTDSTIFDIGSITKQFTAAGILKLEMAGKLSVNDLMSKYFANVPDDKKGITLHQLLTHSAGFPGAIGDDYEDITTADFISLAMSKPLMFNPGSGYEYSNVGYSLLAMIIEKVSGKPYETYLHDNLFQPAGMNNTGYLLPKWNGSLIATGYRNDIRWGKPTEKWTSGHISWHLKGNGGILSTVKDMYKWHQALLTDDILSAEAKEKYYTPFVREGEGANSFYAYGWAIFPTPRNTNLVAHNGGNGIFFADFLRYLDEKVTIIVMCNRSTRYANRIASQIAGIIFTPDFVPTYPEGSGVELNQEETLAIGNGFVEAIAQPDSAKWESFIRDNFSEELFGFVSMDEHLKFFRSFHDDLKDAKMATMDISNNIIQITYDTGKEVVLITLELDQMPSGEIKLGGIMVD